VQYLSCERCGLAIKLQTAYLRLENCPHCLRGSGIVSPPVSRAAADPMAEPTACATWNRRS